MQYELSFVVAGTNVEDDAAVSVLAEQLDAILSRAAGVDLLTVLAEGADAIDAARHAVVCCRVHVPELVFLRLDRDLVGIPEIADRTGRSRQNITQLIAGERRNTLSPFPRPEGTAGRARVWLWTEVNDWLRQLELHDGLAHPTRDEMTDIDSMLRHDRLSTLERPFADAVWTNARSTRITKVRFHYKVQAPTTTQHRLAPPTEPATTNAPIDLLQVSD